MSDEYWVCPWGICNTEQAQECRAKMHTRKGCGGGFPNMSAEQARRQIALKECEHGSLERSCLICELQRDVAQLQAERDALRKQVQELEKSLKNENP